MNNPKRKLLTIITESSIENLIVEDLKKLGSKGYTIMDVRGEGSRGNRSAEWEQNRNIKIEVVCVENEAEKIMTYLQDEYYKNYAMISYLSDVEVIRGEKFS